MMMMRLKVTLAADDLDPHARVSVPLDRVELDVAGEHGVVEVVVLHRERVDVAAEDLQQSRTPPPAFH